MPDTTAATKSASQSGPQRTSDLRLAIVQMSCTNVLEDNLAKAETFVRQAAAKGANVILLQELFESLYFPQLEREELFALAHPVATHPFIERFAKLASELGAVLPISFFEHAGQAYFNSLAMVDADGSVLGVYR
ncbi:MAG TPA: nitrilase-related carbon-nitrogen hydrolase, partial [Trueperaceae bacterium]|nr:nitrilase-related carbon-nitrogen hydrolase [Trueperaceae bacterium]